MADDMMNRSKQHALLEDPSWGGPPISGAET